jgi:SagB-type dehydrogenase family enzyme
MNARARTRRSRWAVVGIAVVTGACAAHAPPALRRAPAPAETIVLPAPDRRGTATLDDVLQRRRSQRSFRPDALPLGLLGQLLWSAQGVTDPAGKRTAPSAGALYPLELYVVSPSALIHYLPEGHRAEVRREPDHRRALADAAFGQDFVARAPDIIVVSSVPRRTRAKYGSRADAFIDREAGHATQNLLLEATSRGLDAVPVGGFDPVKVRHVLALPPDQHVLVLVPTGYPPSGYDDAVGR